MIMHLMVQAIMRRIKYVSLRCPARSPCRSQSLVREARGGIAAAVFHASKMGAMCMRPREILVYCAVGQRSYYASRALRLHGFNARNISGGMRSYHAERQIKVS